MKAYLEARCSQGHDFIYLVGAPAKCTVCGWLFIYVPLTERDFKDAPPQHALTHSESLANFTSSSEEVEYHANALDDAAQD